jgi:hypothetical protein
MAKYSKFTEVDASGTRKLLVSNHSLQWKTPCAANEKSAGPRPALSLRFRMDSL